MRRNRPEEVLGVREDLSPFFSVLGDCFPVSYPPFSGFLVCPLVSCHVCLQASRFCTCRFYSLCLRVLAILLLAYLFLHGARCPIRCTPHTARIVQSLFSLYYIFSLILLAPKILLRIFVSNTLTFAASVSFNVQHSDR